MSRMGQIQRKTKETSIEILLNLDGTGQHKIHTGIGFFDHMLVILAYHSGIDLSVQVQGDLAVDGHHTVEDTGIALGQALAQALGDKRGIQRYGTAYVPMDETLARSVLDISGRSFLVLDASFVAPMVGGFDTQLTQEFFRAVAFQSYMTLHLQVEYGTNDHHKIEALFKAFAHSLKEAIQINQAQPDKILSTKGVL